MRLGVDFAPQDFLGAGNSQYRYLGAQCFPGAKNFLLDFGFRARDNAIGLRLGRTLRFFHYRRAALFRLRNDFVSLQSRTLQFFARALGSEFEILLAALSCRETLRISPRRAPASLSARRSSSGMRPTRKSMWT